MSFDRSLIKPVPIQKTLLLINNFIANTADFFNTFSETVEKKISNVSKKITELETLLAVLEAKLNSVPGIDSAAAPAPTAGASAPIPTAPTAQADSAPLAPASPPVVAPPVEEAPPTDSRVAVCEHPLYLPFFKLLKVGVPSFVVQKKVEAAGLDPSMIDAPDTLLEL
ncbi:WASH complex, subunit CCDC53 [Ochromonadaceae sp. CCMP2298]|nr:WASH complex, subunit CCDC53 [Ochromonadaceae sp. CCMP2298]|mmetsp:Transcript_769/g.1688  ORF Transcript_769/g.1688 Transcript_769/m.1688 type:complete len:168 (+) Transcript_769:179-682(+)